jgi:Spy/CpxP family protein refolding chaperone
MNFSKADLKLIVLTTMLTVAVPLAAIAEPSMEDGPGHWGSKSFSSMMPHSQHCKNDREMSSMPMGLDLSESQQDKIFSIKQAQAQILYDQDKIVRNAYIDLHMLATSEQYDDGKAKVISESLAKARATIAFIHAQEEHGIYAVLTKEQRGLLSSMQGREANW